jgi:hypothetical protein
VADGGEEEEEVVCPKKEVEKIAFNLEMTCDFFRASIAQRERERKGFAFASDEETENWVQRTRSRVELQHVI